MNEYNDYNTSESELDYYTLYTEQKTREARRVFSKCSLALFLYLIIPVALIWTVEYIIILAVGKNAAYDILTNNVYIYWLVSFAPTYVVGFPIFLLITRNIKSMPGQKKKMRVSEFLSLFLIAELALTVGSLIGTTFSEFFAILTNKEATNVVDELVSDAPILLIILVVVIIAPIVEELVFRKILLDKLSRYGSGVAITVTSIAFGLFHTNFDQFFYAVGLGFILGFIYLKTKNIVYPIIMHMLVNFMGSVAILPVTNVLDEYYGMMENIAEGIEVNMSKFLQSSMIVGSYTIIEYTLIGAGIAVLIKYIKKHLIKEYYCDL